MASRVALAWSASGSVAPASIKVCSVPASPLAVARGFSRRVWGISRTEYDDGSQKTKSPVESRVDAADLFTQSREAFEQHIPRCFDDYTIRQAQLDEELWAAAWLRSECYFEGQPHARYIECYKKKFSEQEFTALKKRCFGRYGHSVRCCCLLAVLNSGTSDCELLKPSLSENLLKRIIGTMDVSVRQLLPGQTFPGDDSRTKIALGMNAIRPSQRYGYIANVCVAKSHRRKGIASNLMQVAVQVGKMWRLDRIYVHVNCDNNAARLMYRKKGFQVVQSAINQLSLDQTLLLSLPIN